MKSRSEAEMRAVLGSGKRKTDVQDTESNNEDEAPKKKKRSRDETNKDSEVSRKKRDKQKKD